MGPIQALKRLHKAIKSEPGLIHGAYSANGLHCALGTIQDTDAHRTLREYHLAFQILDANDKNENESQGKRRTRMLRYVSYLIRKRRAA